MDHFSKNDGLDIFRLRTLSAQKRLLRASATASCLRVPPSLKGPAVETDNLLVIVTDENDVRTAVTWQFLINSRNLNGSATAATGKTSNGTLDATNAAQYDQLVQGCLKTGALCIIDVHNYARFEGQVIGQGGPTNAQFARLWSQLAGRYAGEANVVFGIMNEPHQLPNLSAWAGTVQAAVTAIRGAGAAAQTILLPGNDFTHALDFVENGSAGNLSTVTNPDGSTTGLVFEVHQYLDADGSGTALGCVTDHVRDAFQPLAQFLKKSGRKAFLGEIGGGNTTSVRIPNLANMKSELDGR
jgi:endoglucanase